MELELILRISTLVSAWILCGRLASKRKHISLMSYDLLIAGLSLGALAVLIAYWYAQIWLYVNIIIAVFLILTFVKKDIFNKEDRDYKKVNDLLRQEIERLEKDEAEGVKAQRALEQLNTRILKIWGN